MFNDFFHAMTDVMVTDGAVFLGLGMSMFRLMVVLLLMTFGAKTLFLGYFNMREFLPHVAKILLLFAALTYYRVPSPTFGVSLTGMVTDEAAFLSNTLVRASESETVAFQSARAIQKTIDSALPIVPNMLQLMRWTLVTLALSGLQGMIWAVISFGFVGVAILIIVGPLFLPWGIFPGMEGLARMWFMAFLSMNFWQVIGSCYMLVASRILQYFFLGHPTPYTAASTWSLFVPLVMIGFSLTLGAFLIPALAVMLFNAGISSTAAPRFLRWG